MNLTETIIATLTCSLIAGLATWMFKVHAKLAVIASRLVDVADKLEHVTDDHHELWIIATRHESEIAHIHKAATVGRAGAAV